LLQVQWDEGQREEVTSGLCSILSLANSRLDIACPEHCRTSGKIQAKITEIFKPWTLKFKATTNSIANILTINEAASDISRYFFKRTEVAEKWISTFLPFVWVNLGLGRQS
jgi:hypothetical protein